MKNKGLYIKDIQDGQLVEGVFLVRTMSRADTKAGKPYLMLTVMDRTGELAARIWENADRFEKICQPGNVVSLSAQASAYKNILQLKINAAKVVDESDLDITYFLPSTKCDIEQMAAEIVSIVQSVENPHLKSLLLSFFEAQAFFEAFKKAPAAKFMHHAYIGGLLEHTLGVTRLADTLSRLYPDIDRSLLIAGATLHDVGKVAEFSFDVFPFDYSDRGRLVGHMVLGIEMIQNRISTLDNFPEELATQLHHLILSHHGRHEFGSPVLPMIQEAFVLNFLDELDSKINYFSRLGDQAKNIGYQWTDYQKNMERFLYIKGQPDTNSDSPAGTGEQTCNSAANPSSDHPDTMNIDPRQTSLWK